jgi:hypothetical protein
MDTSPFFKKPKVRPISVKNYRRVFFVVQERVGGTAGGERPNAFCYGEQPPVLCVKIPKGGKVCEAKHFHEKKKKKEGGEKQVFVGAD